jgi:VanZ family protein
LSTLPQASRPATTSSLARYRYWILAALAGFWVLIFIATHLPELPNAVEMIPDKLAHATAYLGLSFLLSLAAASTGQLNVRGSSIVLGIAALYGTFDELLQIPCGRDAEYGDWIADMCGALVGLTACLLLRSIYRAVRPSGQS